MSFTILTSGRNVLLINVLDFVRSDTILQFQEKSIIVDI